MSDDSAAEAGPAGGAEYTPSPFRYPESNEAAAMAGAGAGAGVAGAGTRPSGDGEKLNSPPTPAFATETSTQRPSMESNHTNTTGVGVTEGTGAATAGHGPSTWSEVGATDSATIGHDAKPAQGSPAGGVRPLPTTPQQASTRFVQHEDSGEVV